MTVGVVHKWRHTRRRGRAGSG